MIERGLELEGCAVVFSTRFDLEENPKMKFKMMPAFAVLVAGSSAWAASTMSTVPGDSWTVTNYYKQSVYDPKETKIGDVEDVLLDKSGKVTALIIGVGGFLGAGEKDVAVPFSAVKPLKKQDKWYLTLDETKDSLKSAAGYKFDKASTTWVAEK
jgi:sporulation protein YlmC with PRC-barrel domain